MLKTLTSEHDTLFEDLQKYTRPLRDRMELDYKYFRGELFAMPKDEGKWDCVTTNRPTTEGNKIIDYLAYARRKLWIPITDDKEKERKDLSDTEKLAIGVIRLADEIAETDPFGKNIQNLLCFYATVTGWTIPFVYLKEEDGKLVPILTAYDFLNTAWISGGKGLNYFHTFTLMSKEEVEAEYQGINNVNYDSNDITSIHFVCDKEEMGTYIGNEWVDKPTKHGLDHIPVRIKSCRSTPLRQSGKFTDAIKDVGESYLANYRYLIDPMSRLMTYKLHRAGLLAKMPIFIGYDSTKGGKPPEFDANPQAKGAVVPLDVGKGLAILPYQNMTAGVSIQESAAEIESAMSMGGMAKIAYGAIDAALPAQGIDLLGHAALDAIKPFMQHVERDFIWIAEEVIRQFVNGDFGKVELEGYDKANNRFRVEVKPDDVKTNWRFECELVPNLIRDEQMYMNMATQAKGSDLLPTRMILDKYGLSDDPDLAMQMKDEERASEIAEIKLWEMAAALKADGNEMGFQIVMNKLIQLAQGQMGQGNAPKQPGMQPGGQVRLPNMNLPGAQVPPELQQKAQAQRMANMVQG